jgi:hypothetical protein
MDSILQAIQELEGVLGAVAIGASGQVMGYRAHSVYDAALIEHVAGVVAKAVDSIQLLHDDWEGLTASFADGRLLIRNLALGGAPSKNGLRALAVIADGRLNASFAGVAIRVAVTKLKALDAMRVSSPTLNPAVAAAPMFPVTAAQSMSTPAVRASAPEIAASGLSWSGLGGSSGTSASGVTVSDPASAAYLTGCTKALARSVGPMAKAFVKEAIRKMWPNRPFSRDFGPALAAELERHIEDKADLAQFRGVVRSL